jgi:hypothetical protein
MAYSMNKESLVFSAYAIGHRLYALFFRRRGEGIRRPT